MYHGCSSFLLSLFFCCALIPVRKECSWRRGRHQEHFLKISVYRCPQLFCVLTALIAYGAGSLARRLAGCLAFAASTFFHCILKVFRIQCFNVLHHSSSFPLLLAVQCALAKPLALLAHGLRPISSSRILAVTMLRMLPSPVL